MKTSLFALRLLSEAFAVSLVAVLAVGNESVAEVADQGQGWIDLLADGLEPWVVDARPGELENHRKKWTIGHGVLHNSGGGYGFLRYDKRLSDFEFKGEYRLPGRGNSGIGIRSVPYTGGRQTRPSFAAYELQLVDDYGQPPTRHSTMSLYRYVAPRANPSKPAGEWNSFHVICRGPKIIVHLNGEEILNIDQREHEEIEDKPLSGYLMLQNHGSEVDFRNLRLLVE